MSIATEISRLQTAKANIKTSIENKGITVGSGVTLDGYSTLIDSIQPNLQSKTVSPSGSSILVEPDSGYDGLDQVRIDQILLTNYTVRPDAELVKTYTCDRHLVADDEITLPEYTETATSILASYNLDETYTVDNSAYYYYIVQSFLIIPEYNVSTTGKGRQEYFTSSSIHELAMAPANVYSAIVNPNKKVTTIYKYMADAGICNINAFWSSTTNFTVSTTVRGLYMSRVAPTISGDSVTLKSPGVYYRGHASYSSSAFYSEIRDVRYQWTIKIFRSKIGDYNIEGWAHSQNMLHIAECVTSNTHTLT